MANQTSQRIWSVDTVGIISTGPVVIDKIIYYVAEHGDVAKFTYWDESSTAQTTKSAATVSATASTRTLVSTGNFATADVDVGDIVKILASNSNNVGTYMVATNADNNTITVGAAQTILDDTSKTYAWKTWRPSEFLTLSGSKLDGDDTPVVFDFCGFRVPNLCLESISANGRILIYLS